MYTLFQTFSFWMLFLDVIFGDKGVLTACVKSVRLFLDVIFGCYAGASGKIT